MAREVAPSTFLEAILEMSDDAIFTCDVAARVTAWSSTSERLFGRTADAVLDGALDALFPEHLRDEVRAVVNTVLAGERIRHFETEVQRPDGMPLPVSLSLCPVFDTDDTPIGVVAVARDVTEQRLAQASLAEVDARLEEGEALAHLGSWLWDLRTGSVQWSAEFHRIHGVDPLDFDGTFDSYLGLIHLSDREIVRAAMLESVESGRPFEGEYRVICPDRQLHVVHVRAQPTMGSAGTAVGLRGIGQDVTERRDTAVRQD
jgi:PAS domain S-box-containing protein